jgi:hypothetical protein
LEINQFPQKDRPQFVLRLAKQIEGPQYRTENEREVEVQDWSPFWPLYAPICFFFDDHKNCTLGDFIGLFFGFPPHSKREEYTGLSRSKTVKIGVTTSERQAWADGEVTVESFGGNPVAYKVDSYGSLTVELADLLAQINAPPADHTILISASIGEVKHTENIQIPAEVFDVVFAAREAMPPKIIQPEVPKDYVSDVDLPTYRRQKKHSYAIVIGIEQYRQKLPKADFAAHDAKIMKEYLVQLMSYKESNIVSLTNEQATKGDFEKYVESWLPNHVEKDNSVFIYFSGHGAPNPKTGDAYLVPFDGDPAFIDKTGYSIKRLYENLAKLPAKDIIVVLDSCFSGAGGRSVLAEGVRPMVLRSENPFMPNERIVVLSASSENQISNTLIAKRHGLLTYFLLKGLQGEGDQNRDGAIDIDELYEYVKPEVERAARRDFNSEQTPQLLAVPSFLKKGVRLVEKPN